jgi:hypothetical protein
LALPKLDDKKQMQAIETETPMMLLFVSNRTAHSSISTDLRQLLELAYNNIESELMMPEEYKNRDMPAFSLKLHVPCLPEKKKDDNKAYDPFREQGKRHSISRLQNLTYLSSSTYPTTPTR